MSMSYGFFSDQRKHWSREEGINFMNKFCEAYAEKKQLQNPMTGKTSSSMTIGKKSK